MRVYYLPARYDTPFLCHNSGQAAKPAQVSLIPRSPTQLKLFTVSSARCVRVVSAAKRDELPTVTQPFSVHDVDRELWMVLDLASDTELEGVHDMLFGAES